MKRTICFLLTLALLLCLLPTTLGEISENPVGKTINITMIQSKQTAEQSE